MPSRVDRRRDDLRPERWCRHGHGRVEDELPLAGVIAEPLALGEGDGPRQVGRHVQGEVVATVALDIERRRDQPSAVSAAAMVRVHPQVVEERGAEPDDRLALHGHDGPCRVRCDPTQRPRDLGLAKPRQAVRRRASRT